MIYLFDDKESRQQSYGWTNNKFELWSDVIVRIQNYSDYLLLEENDIFKEGNIIIYHESFSNCIPYEQRNDFNAFRDLIIINGTELPDVNIVIFGGGIKSRDINKNVAHVHVTDMYANLECFLEHHSENDTDFKYLLWGEEYQIEQVLLDKIEEISNEIYEGDIESNWSNVFFASAQKYGIDAPSNECVQEKLWLSKVKDEDLDNYIREWFCDSEYEALYIPLCFGKILSDYNGLRFAIHIRCTDSLNRNKPIYIYSPVPSSFLIRSQYFDILKTKGVKLISMRAKTIVDSLGYSNPLTENDIKHQMEKVHLPVPQNYENSHSIANEWAIYRWAVATKSEDDAIENVLKTIKSNLYFKHLSTIYPPSEKKVIREDKLKIKDRLSCINDSLVGQKDIKILYVDDEADKGWYEIMANIIHDVNKINGFDYFGEELKALSQEVIIDKVFNRVKVDSVNLVLLDFRLHKSDHDSQNIENITSVQILRKIKEYNPGIQVIIFSATNKVWNLLALQKYGADGFIIKEGPENSKDPSFTIQTIENFINSLSISISNRYKKYLCQTVSDLNSELEKAAKNKSFKTIDKGFQKKVKLFYSMAYSSLPQSIDSPCFDHSFMNYFRTIEATANYLIEVENPEEKERNGKLRYTFKFRGTDEYLKDYSEEEFSEAGRKLSIPTKRLNFKQKFYNLFALLGVYSPSTFEMVEKRNALTHPNSIENFKVDPITLEDVLLAANISFQCIKKLIERKTLMINE